jgi:VRR-NUC domain
MSNRSIVACLKRFLEASCHTAATTLFPSLLIALPRDELDGTQKPGTTMADLAIRYFLRLGLRCDRTREDLHGYPGLFRDLIAPPPWVEVTPDDTKGPVSVERETELRPLYVQANQTDPELLVEKYRGHLKYQRTTLEKVGLLLTPPAITRLSVELFREKLELARFLGIEQFETIFDSVLEPFDEFRVMPGVPDLLVWSESDQLWFFAEVKGPRDSLRESQGAWIRAHWETIRGRFALVLLHEA